MDDMMIETAELLEDIREAEAELDAGLGVPHEQAMAALREMFRGR